MTNPNWGILQPVDVVGRIQEGFEHGQKMREKRDLKNALAQYASAPNDPAPLNALMQLAPEMALRLREDQRKEQGYQDGRKFTAATGRYYGQPAPVLPQTASSLGPPSQQQQTQQMQQPMAQQPTAQQPAQPVLSERDRAFHEMMQIDPVKAMKIDSDARNQAIQNLKDVDDVYDLAIARLGRVTDENTYQATLKEVSARFAPYGVDISTVAPAQYPGPEGVRALLQSALNAKEQLAALDRRDRLDWDMDDDEDDNARADREANSRINSRDRSAKNAERRTEIAATRPPPSTRKPKAAAVTATNPQTGETITLNSRGQWTDKNGKPIG